MSFVRTDQPEPKCWSSRISNWNSKVYKHCNYSARNLLIWFPAWTVSTGSSSGVLWRLGRSSPSSLLPRSLTSTRISNRSLVCFPFVLLLIYSNQILQLIWFRTKVYLQTNFLFKHRLAPNLLLVRKKDMVSIELGKDWCLHCRKCYPHDKFLFYLHQLAVYIRRTQGPQALHKAMISSIYANGLRKHLSTNWQTQNENILQPLRRISSSSVPLITRWNLPIPIAVPIPISILDILAHGLDKGLHRAHTIFLFWATLDTGQRRNTVINNDAYLRAW